MLHTSAPPKFTKRQREIVHLIARGYSNLEIASLMGISPRTAKAHSDVLRTKLRVSRKRHIPAAFREATGEDPHSLRGLGPSHREQDASCSTS